MRGLITAALLGAAGLVQAADDERLDSLTITVTADAPESNLPLAVTTIEADEQPAPNQQSMQDWLETVPGLFALNNDNAAQGLRVAIRGFGSRAAFGVRGIKVIVDGVPMTLPDGQTELDALDLALLDSATVIRGPSATLFGNASGGAILLNSRPTADTPYLRSDLTAGNHGYRRFRLEVGGHQLLGSYLHNEFDGFRDHAKTESDLINASLKQALCKGQITASISSLDIEALDPGGLTAEQVDTDRSAARPQNIQFNAGET
ncbi:MAG: TonB-dependent receptor plug domain-containing protein, partial [Salinisphaeraceae bacterium]|nr:TonB-dependent receptor plug domain-containing protein [Salinisphaeraceae bacterium]